MRKIIGFTSAFSILGDLGQCLSLHTQALASVLQAFFSLLSHSVMSDFCNSMEPTRLLCPWRFSRKEYWSGLPCPPPGDLPNPGIKPRTAALQADFLPFEPPGKLINTGVGSLPLLQWIFPTQESNQGFLHGRRILYQLSLSGTHHKFYIYIIYVYFNKKLVLESK